MRNLTCVGAVLFAIVGVSAGCADDESGSGGAGGSVETTTSTATSTSPSTTTTGTSTTSSSASTSGSSTSTGMPGCEEIQTAFVEAQSFSSWSGDVSPELGGADPDYAVLGIPIGSDGTITLELPGNIDDCSDTDVCVIIFEDFVDPNPPTRVYASAGGILTLDAPTSPATASGSLADVELVEVTLDGQTGALTPVKDGACLSLPTADFEFQGK